MRSLFSTIAPIIAAVTAAACAARTPPPATPSFPLGWRVVDLTWPLAPDIPTFSGQPTYTARTQKTVEADGYYIAGVTLDEHTGTHVDAPSHFATGGAGVDQLPLEQLVGPAAVVDVTAAVAANPDHAVTVADLRAWESQHGALGARTIVLIRTGWAERWREPARYRNPDPQGVMHYPGVSVEASRYLTERGVRAIGIDTLSTDPGPSATFEQHKQFLSAGGLHIENVAHLDQLPATGAVVVIAPLPFRGGSGAPARVLAFVPSP
jgi:kynurenine formamidase